MEKWNLTFIFCSVILIITQGVECCERSLEVRGVEDHCWAEKVEVSERIHKAGEKVLNFGRKKIGMDVDQPDEPQKCDYYYCIFQEMKLLNTEYDVPCKDKLTKWIKNNVIFNQAEILLERVKNCTGELANALESSYDFQADNVDAEVRNVDPPSEPQSKCDISKEYMKCLSAVEKDEKCPVFEYP